MGKKVVIQIGNNTRKAVGALIIFASGLGILDSASRVFTAIKQLDLAKTNIDVALNAFGLMPEAITPDLIWGKLMLPMGTIFLWLAFLLIGAAIYKNRSLEFELQDTGEAKESKKEKKKEAGKA